MNKKNILVSACLLLVSISLLAQSLEEGRSDMEYQRYASAKGIFHSILKQDPSNAAAWFLLTKTYLLADESPKAIDSLALAPASIAGEPYFLIAKGAMLLEKNDTVGAAALFQQAIDDTKGRDAGILLAVADMHIESAKGNPHISLALLEKAIKRDKKNAALFISQGRAHRKLHNGTAAFQSFREAIDKDKKAAAAYYELGRIFLTQKNVDVYKEYFQQAIEADRQFGPAYYALYDHYLYLDPVKANEYFQQYVANSDQSLQQDYARTDLLYLTKRYDEAIEGAAKLIQSEGDSVQARLYKLIAYSYQEKKDSSRAMDYMRNYFQKEVDSNFVVKDFETMSALYSTKGNDDSAMLCLEKAVALSTDSIKTNGYYQQLAGLARKTNNYAAESHWLGKYYTSNARASNITLFNWGLAAYKAQDYTQADSVFGLYTSKYPEQGFGYYWRARSNAAIDTAMEQGLAIAHYQQLLDVINKDSLSETDRKWMKEAYAYLASYETNTEKDYPEAIGYFEKLLEIDPANEQAQRYIEILEKNLEAREKTTTEGK